MIPILEKRPVLRDYAQIIDDSLAQKAEDPIIAIFSKYTFTPEGDFNWIKERAETEGMETLASKIDEILNARKKSWEELDIELCKEDLSNIACFSNPERSKLLLERAITTNSGSIIERFLKTETIPIPLLCFGVSVSLMLSRESILLLFLDYLREKEIQMSLGHLETLPRGLEFEDYKRMLFLGALSESHMGIISKLAPDIRLDDFVSSGLTRPITTLITALEDHPEISFSRSSLEKIKELSNNALFIHSFLEHLENTIC